MADYSPYIFRIQRYSIHDGPGIRTTLFFQGCPLACRWCHNPESQAMHQKISETEVPDLVDRLLREIEKDLIYYDDSGGGVTLSGGEPLCQPELLWALIAACREREIHTCLDTSGYAPADALERAARAADLVLYDIKAVDTLLHERITGKPVARVLENLVRLDRLDTPCRLRFPLIPGYTDSEENISDILDFLGGQNCFRDIHILPYHNTAEAKYRQ
ncbi:MAG: radical SAM protein, partial [Desulfobacterales bacterium]|nr:radical SAM protein [Desulfobacterales bacterium]